VKSGRDAPRGRAGMREVAAAAGVAMSSVSRVLSGHPDVSPGMRERVLDAVEQLGYQPNLLAQSLRWRETLTVGFVVGDISNPLLATIVEGAETTLRDAGYSMLLTNSEGDPALDASHVKLFERRQVDGLILSLARDDHSPTLELLGRVAVPMVVVDRDVPVAIEASRVLADHRKGMRAAVEHLVDLGHRRIGLIVGQSIRPTTERVAALEEVFAQRGLEPTFSVHRGPTMSDAWGEQATRELLDGPEPPTAIIAGGNQLLIGSLRVLAERGIEIGAGLSLVGCDDVAITELFRPPIATVRRDNRAMGRVAAELLLRRLKPAEDDAGPEEVVIPTEFVPRQSCVAPAGA
jgi:LacI family transcriptional regulator